MAAVKFLKKLEFATDYNPASPGSETRTEIPQTRIRQNESAPFGEIPQTQAMVSGHDAQAAAKGSGAWAVVIDDDNRGFIDDLVAAADALTPVWFFATPFGGRERTIGGETGCLVTVTEQAYGEFGDFAVAVIAANVGAGSAGGTFSVAAAA